MIYSTGVDGVDVDNDGAHVYADGSDDGADDFDNVGDDDNDDDGELVITVSSTSESVAIGFVFHFSPKQHPLSPAQAVHEGQRQPAKLHRRLGMAQ